MLEVSNLVAVKVTPLRFAPLTGLIASPVAAVPTGEALTRLSMVKLTGLLVSIDAAVPVGAVDVP